MREKTEKVEEMMQVVVPPGFRFHPTDEELVDFYLRKKVGRPIFELDHIIPEVDLNKLEPWDLREKCKVDASHQTEWYFFSHKDKKYPTGTRTNRATKAGFWKATGRDKAVLASLSRPHHFAAGERIGMRKTLVFYKGRAPHGLKTDWIMHEYRLQDANSMNHTCKMSNEDGWVVCRVFKKKNYEEKSSTRASSYDNSNSNLSDEDPSPIKSTHSISKTKPGSSQTAMSTLQPATHEKPLKMEGEVINNLVLPTMKAAVGNNLGVFSCKQEIVCSHHHYSGGLGIKNNVQPTTTPFYQLPYLESTEINAPNYLPNPSIIANNMNPNLSTISTCPSILLEKQTKRLENTQKSHQLSQYMSNYESNIHSGLGVIPSQFVSKSMITNEEDISQCIASNLQSNGHNLTENLQGWSLYENLARLQGSAEAAMVSAANDQLFPYISSTHINKAPQAIDHYPSSYEIELWNFQR